MDEALFDELMQSVREADAIMRGESEPARITERVVPDVKRIRQRLGLSQKAFAQRLNVSVRTVQNWEQKRRFPTGPARVLLALCERQPELLLQ